MHGLHLSLISLVIASLKKRIKSFWMQVGYLMDKNQNLFDLIYLVGSIDKLIPSDFHEGKHHKPYPIVGRNVLGKERSHICEFLYKYMLFFSFWEYVFLFYDILVCIPLKLNICRKYRHFDWWMIKHGIKTYLFWYGAHILYLP